MLFPKVCLHSVRYFIFTRGDGSIKCHLVSGGADDHLNSEALSYGDADTVWLFCCIQSFTFISPSQ